MCLFLAVVQLDLDVVLPLKQRIIAQYGDQVKDKSTLKSVMATCQVCVFAWLRGCFTDPLWCLKAYSMAKTPVMPLGNGVGPNPSHRVVQVFACVFWYFCP